MDKKPKVGVGTFIINKENKILLGQRINSHGNETWGLPGGHLEFFEEIEDCAKREIKEETGLNIKDVEILTITNDIFKKENKHYITIFTKSIYNGSDTDVKIMEPDKCKKWDWFSWDNLPDKLFLPLENLKKRRFDPINHKL